MNLTTSAYGVRAVTDLPFDDAVARITEALKEQGFGILTEIDVQTTLREKLGAEFRRYVILGACNPPLAHQALTTELEVGLLLPCNVIVYEADGGGSVVAMVDPAAMLGVVGGNQLDPVAAQARSKMLTALEAIAA